MRIGINTLFLVPGDVGGTEVYLRQTLRAMLGQLGQDRLVLFTNRENHSLFQKDMSGHPQVDLYPLPCPAARRPLRIVMEQILLPYAVRKAQVEVLWSPGYTAPACCPVPQAVTVCDLQYKSHPEDMSWIERITLDILVRTACRRCQAILSISEFSRQELLRHGFASADKVHAVLLGVSPQEESTSEKRKTLVEHLGLRSPFLLCVAHTYPHKKVDTLIAAFALLQQQIPHDLVLVGKGRRGEESVQKSLQQLEQPQRVHRLQGLSGEEMQALYQQAALFILPSHYEGFGLPVIEALAAGLPVLTTTKASLPEVGGAAALYVDQAEAHSLANTIQDILNLSPKARWTRIQEGQDWAKNFTWERTARQTLAVLRNLQQEKTL
jgi:glycosyltransferase involved in cell wall biosynthesis